MSTASPRDALAQRIRDLTTAHAVVRETLMFGGLAFMVDERLAVSAGRGGDLLVRTNPEDYDALLQRGGSPARMGTDRPMGRGWLTVPARRLQDDAELEYWVKVGIDSRNASS